MIGLVNILAGKKIVPELIQFDLTTKNLFKEAQDILFEPDRSMSITEELYKVKESLGKEEIQIGTVRVTDVQAKLARAEIITSSIDLAAEFAPKSFIVRPVKETKQSAVKRQAKLKKELKADFEEFEKSNDDDW